MMIHWGIYELVGDIVPYDCGVGEEGIFKIVCSCRALIVDMYSCDFCEMWCLVRVGGSWWVESGLGHV